MTLTEKNPGNKRVLSHDLATLVKPNYGIKCGVPMEEAIRRADERGVVLASNRRMSQALIGSNEWRCIEGVAICWTGTMAAYDKPDQKLGDTIEYVDPETSLRYVFPVPEEHQGKKNVVLVAEHPDFAIETDGMNRIVRAKNVEIVPAFPVYSHNFYLGDPKYDIPTGESIFCINEAARYLIRFEKNVSLVARDVFTYESRRYVLLDFRPSEKLDVVAEIPNPGKQFRIREENGSLVVDGTPAQIAAAARLLEKVK